MTVPILAVTSGEPAGIGPISAGICPKPIRPAAAWCWATKPYCRRAPKRWAKACSCKTTMLRAHRPPACSKCCTFPCAALRSRPLEHRKRALCAATAYCAYEGVQAGEFAALVTAPLHKGILNDAGIAFTGYTEYLAEKSGTDQVVMMLAGGGLRVALATTRPAA